MDPALHVFINTMLRALLFSQVAPALGGGRSGGGPCMQE